MRIEVIEIKEGYSKIKMMMRQEMIVGIPPDSRRFLTESPISGKFWKCRGRGNRASGPLLRCELNAARFSILAVRCTVSCLARRGWFRDEDPWNVTVGLVFADLTPSGLLGFRAP